MKKKIRQSVFETNSSSVHSIVIKREIPLEKSNLKLDSLGRISLKFLDFTQEDKFVYETQQDKLNYYVTCIALNIAWTNPITDFEEFIREIEFYLDDIREHADAAGFVLDGNSRCPEAEGYMDDIKEYIYDYKGKEFVFDKDIIVEVSWG